MVSEGAVPWSKIHCTWNSWYSISVERRPFQTKEDVCLANAVGNSIEPLLLPISAAPIHIARHSQIAHYIWSRRSVGRRGGTVAEAPQDRYLFGVCPPKQLRLQFLSCV